MLTVTPAEIQNSGGLLAALSDASCRYVRGLIDSVTSVDLGSQQDGLERIIVHTNPHIDEYFSEIIFRSCLAPERQSCGFLEQSIFSKTNDLACQHLWPTSAVLGIGGTISGGVKALYLYDEHVVDDQIGKSSRSAPSCSQLVASKLIPTLPRALEEILREVNAIDEFANAHEQSLANMIKALHEVRFIFRMDANGTTVSDRLTPEWKRAIIDACIAAVAYCLETGIDLVGSPEEKKKLLDDSIEYYRQHSAHIAHPQFPKALQFIGSTFGDQKKVFQEAVLENRRGPILDPAGKQIPQLLLFSRVLFACDRCWGEKIRNLVAAHFWEVAMQGQLNFVRVRDAVHTLFVKNIPSMSSEVGFLAREILPPTNVGGGRKAPVWLVAIAPDSSVFLANKGVGNYINKENNVEPNKWGTPKGCGLILVQDRVRATTALFKCSGVPEQKWEALVTLIKEREQDCWHVIQNPSGGIAPFILNGTATHQYVPRTGMDLSALAGLVRHTFY